MTGASPPAVAVVIPCFNQAHYLAEAIESVLSQTLSPAEVVVVDDGSEDNSHEVAGRYEKVTRMRQRNRGVAAARNAGMQATSSEYLVFLDADDRLLPEAIEMGAGALARRPNIAFVSGFSRDIGDDGRVLPGERQPLVTQDHYLRLLEDCFIWSGSSIVYRRSALEAVGGFDESLGAGDDYDLYLRLARRFPIFCHETVVTEYRRHGTNTTRDPGVVLDSELDVLRRQRSSVHDKREREARRRGIRRTRREHGRALAGQIAEDWARHRRRHALHGIGTLIRHDPQGVTYLLEAA
ncbi:MAG TPA: glycosyltransferase [Solirubrobacterales bacterium]|nr:glycosyltransferase [Solirubrobacterales bacterium]